MSYLSVPDENIVAIAKRYIKTLKVPVSDTSIEEELLSHPDFPSMLSLSECFTNWHIENAALKLNAEALKDLETPFVTSLSERDEMSFAIVRNITESEVEVEFQEAIQKLSRNEFLNRWSGSVLLAEKNADSGEKEYARKKRAEIYHSAQIPLMLIVFGGILVYLIQAWPQHSGRAIALLINSTVGVLISTLLFKIHYSAGNIGICKIGDKSDCKLILNSPAAKIWGISFAEIGIVFFLTNVTIILISAGINASAYFSLLGLLGLLSLPYTVFSLYYQWRVAKAWCILCLSVQALLWINAALIYPAVFPVKIEMIVFVNILLSMIAISTVLFVLRPLVQRASQYKVWKFQYKQMKTNKEIFLNTLRSQRVMPTLYDQVIPITIGNPMAEHTITFVTNPNCSPCAAIHKKLEEIVSASNQIKVQVIFYACSEGPKKIAQHLLAIDREGGNAHEAMAFWFDQGKKNITAFKEQFPSAQNEKYADLANAHCQWCIDSVIPHTPFLFVDGYAVPKFYELEEMMVLLNTLTITEVVERSPAYAL